MILNVILSLLASIFIFVINLLPSFSFIDNMINAKNEFIEFISSFMPYTLYLFNVPVLKFAVGLLISYLTFLAGEYLIKLAIKYFTNVF